jgi:hypothetical protein
MRYLILIVLLVTYIGCKEEEGKETESCRVTDLGDEVMIECPDQDPVYVQHGEDGEQGPQGEKGDKGEQGETGADGRDGESCTVTETIEGAIIECNGSQVTIYNGEDGEDGKDGIDGVDGVDGNNASIEIIDPCGTNPDIYNEILIKFDETTYIAYFQSGNKRHLAQIKPGTYVTTDAEKCRFTITEDYEYIEE